ncbi:hypothetical protein [Ruminococcus sp. XPD3002]|uniref:hypothetical protein n=1 Tax=Ruminococcus sp. XPD3002 TaxID=1452269 RepID=UPI0009141422|nr:hypothetical protein [Ruminococcus sp.]MBR6983789.1 hypothetical protein [Ruminococcus sp.]SFX96299.1 hypothetical protein SAMN04487832_11768 [Ruminococcus flavefaciens]HRU98246.1 hypothetical protein [Ruminococcus sp.]
MENVMNSFFTALSPEETASVSGGTSIVKIGLPKIPPVRFDPPQPCGFSRVNGFRYRTRF